MSWCNEELIETRKIGEPKLLGCFARKFIPADTLLGVFSGSPIYIPLNSDGLLDLEKFDLHFNNTLQICRFDKGVVCFIERDEIKNKCDTPIDFINHSCKPNCQLRSSIQMWSLTDIEKDSEICSDYRETDFVPEGIECWCDTDKKCII